MMGKRMESEPAVQLLAMILERGLIGPLAQESATQTLVLAMDQDTLLEIVVVILEKEC